MVRNLFRCSPRHFYFVVFALLVLPATLLFAQENAGGPLANVAAAMAKLGPLTGAWEGEAVLRGTQYTKGSKSPLQASFDPILSNSHLKASLRYAVGEKPFEAQITFSYDFLAKQYRAYWIDSLGSPPLLFNGGFVNPSTLVLNASRKQAGQVVRERLRLAFSTSGEWELASSSDASGQMTEQAVLSGRGKKK